MPDTERITNPSMGSNELGTETNEPRQTGGLSAGTDTQLNLTAAGHKKSKKQKMKSSQLVQKATSGSNQHTEERTKNATMLPAHCT